MTDFRAELMQRPGAAHDPALLDAIAYESRTMLLILAAIVVVAALNIAAGFVVLTKPSSEQAD